VKLYIACEDGILKYLVLYTVKNAITFKYITTDQISEPLLKMFSETIVAKLLLLLLLYQR
jgi:hypothetical protein